MVGLLSLRAEMQEEMDEHEERIRTMERTLTKQTRLLAEVTTLAKVTPALEARVTYIENEVPALEVRVNIIEPDVTHVPTLEARVSTMEPTVARVPTLEQSVAKVCTEMGDLIQQLKQGGRGPGGGGMRPLSLPDEWADWKTQAKEILGVTAVNQKAINNYDCFDQNCQTKYFNKSAALQSYINHDPEWEKCRV